MAALQQLEWYVLFIQINTPVSSVLFAKFVLALFYVVHSLLSSAPVANYMRNCTIHNVYQNV